MKVLACSINFEFSFPAAFDKTTTKSFDDFEIEEAASGW
jgi:hypothetical protein